MGIDFRKCINLGKYASDIRNALRAQRFGTRSLLGGLGLSSTAAAAGGGALGGGSGDGSLGLASGWLTAQAQVGEVLQLRLRQHKRFRLEDNAQRPLILIGNGSGIAGAHNDIAGPEVAHLIWHAALA